MIPGAVDSREEIDIFAIGCLYGPSLSKTGKAKAYCKLESTKKDVLMAPNFIVAVTMTRQYKDRVPTQGGTEQQV